MDETDVDGDEYDDGEVDGDDEGYGDCFMVWDAVGFVNFINDVGDWSFGDEYEVGRDGVDCTIFLSSLQNKLSNLLNSVLFSCLYMLLVKF